MKRKPGRDESIEHLLKESMQGPWQTPTSGSCPDAEILAAWTDGGLEGRELATTREHVAGCVSCQATLAVLARTAPPEATPLPWWQRVPSARWLVPVAATATAIAIWVAVPREEYTRLSQDTAVRESTASQSESLRSAAESPTALPRATADAAVQGSPPAPPGATELRVDAEKAAPERQNASSPPREQATPAPIEPTADAAAGALARQEGAPPPPAPSVTTPQPAAPAPTSSRPDPVATPQLRGFGALQETAAVALQAVIASPDTAFRWRIGVAGSVEYSADMGETWEARPTGAQVDLIAGASPSGTVCWIVGRAGTILLTTNGIDWRRVTSPTTIDLRTVEASDSRTATVTAANGRRFRTTDGGTSWQAV